MPKQKLIHHYQQHIAPLNINSLVPFNISIRGKALPNTEIIHDFLNDSKTILLLTGAAFSGKTIWCHALIQQLLADQNSEIPVYIALSPEDDSTQVVRDRLHSYGLNDSDIEASKALPLLFIFDGYEKLGSADNLYICNQLKYWPKAKCIITSRSHYYIHHLLHASSHFCVFAEEKALPTSLLQVTLLPIALEILLSMLDTYLVQSAQPLSSMQKSRLKTWVQSKPSIYHTLAEPTCLSSIISQICALSETCSDEVYHQALISTWLKWWQDYHQAEYPSLSREEALSYAQAVAAQLQPDGYLPFQKRRLPLMARIKQNAAHNPLEFSIQRHRLLFAQAPIMITQGRIHFADPVIYQQLLHLSFTQDMALPLSTNANATMVTQLDTTVSASIITANRDDTSSSTLTTHFLNRRLYTHSSLIQFFAESILADAKQSQAKIAFYLKFIEASKDNLALAIAAANAITILNLARFSFSGMDLRGIQVPYALLNYMVAESTDFSGADLSHVNFIGAYLAGAKFHATTLVSIIWGELGTLLWNTGSICGLRFIKDDSELMAWGDSNTIACYHTPFTQNNTSAPKTTIARIPSWSSSHHAQRIESAQLIEWRQQLITSGNDRKIYMVDMLSCEPRHTIADFTDEPRLFTYRYGFPLCLTPNETQLFYVQEGSFGGKLCRLSLGPIVNQITHKQTTVITRIGDSNVSQLLCLDDTRLAMVQIIPVTVETRYQVSIYQLSDNRKLKILPGYHIAVSQEHKQLAIASVDEGPGRNNLIELYHLDDLTLLYTIHHTHSKAMHSGADTETAIRSLVYVPKRSHGLLCSAGDDGCVLFWDISMPSQRPIRTLHAHVMPISAMAISSQGKYLVTATGELNLRGHDTGERILRVYAIDTLLSQKNDPPNHHGRPAGFTLDTKHSCLYSAGFDGYIHTWSAKTGIHLRECHLPTLEVNADDIRAIHRDGSTPQTLLLQLNDHTYRLHMDTHPPRLQTWPPNNRIERPKGISGPCDDVFCSQDGTRYVYVYQTGIVVYLQTGELAFQYTHPSTHRAMFAGLYDHLLAVLCGTQLSVLDGFDGSCHYSIDGLNATLTTLAPHKETYQTWGIGAIASSSEEMNYLAFGFNHLTPDREYQQHLVIIDPETKVCLMHEMPSKGRIISLCNSPSGRWLASGDDEGCIRLWDMRLWQQVGEITNFSHGSALHQLDFIDEIQLIGQHADASLKSWIIYQDNEQHYQLRLQWSSTAELSLTQSSFANNQGLQTTDRWLLQSQEVHSVENTAALDEAITWGLMHWHNKDYVQAIPAFTQALQEDAKCALAYLYRGLACFKLGGLTEARQDFIFAVALPDLAIRKTSYYYLGKIHIKGQIFDEAERYFDMAKKIKLGKLSYKIIDDKHIDTQLMILAINKADVRQVESLLAQGVDPRIPLLKKHSHTPFDLCYRLFVNESLSALTASKEINISTRSRRLKQIAKLLVNRIEALNGKLSDDRMLLFKKQGNRQVSSSPTTSTSSSSTDTGNKDLQATNHWLLQNQEVQFAENTETLDHTMALGLKYWHDEDYESAISAFTQVLQQDAKCAMAYLYRGLAYFKLSDWTEAKQDFLFAASLPDLAIQKTSYYYLGKIYFKRELSHKAKNYFSLAKKIPSTGLTSKAIDNIRIDQELMKLAIFCTDVKLMKSLLAEGFDPRTYLQRYHHKPADIILALVESIEVMASALNKDPTQSLKKKSDWETFASSSSDSDSGSDSNSDLSPSPSPSSSSNVSSEPTSSSTLIRLSQSQHTLMPQPTQSQSAIPRTIIENYLSPHEYKNPDLNKILRFAAAVGDKNTVKCLLTAGVPIDTPDNLSSKTALHYAYANEQLDMVTYLIQKGANPNHRDICGDTPEECYMESQNRP